MTTITLPPDLEGRLADEASRRGTTAEVLAVDSLRQMFPSKPVETNGARNLREFLGDFVGAVEGTGESFSKNTGERFTDLLIEDRERKRARQQRSGS